MEVTILNTIQLSFATVSLRSDGLVHTHIELRDSVTLDQAQQLTDTYNEITNNVKTPHLFTANKFVIIEKDVMEFMKNVANKYGKADALVVSTLPQRLVANFYIKVVKPQVPTKFFTSKEKAVEWLKQFLK